MKQTKKANDTKFFKDFTKFYIIYLQYKKNNSKLGTFLILVSQLQILSCMIKQYFLFWEADKQIWNELFGLAKNIYNYQNIVFVGDIFDTEDQISFNYFFVILLISCCCGLHLVAIFLLMSILVNYKNGMNLIKYMINIPQIYEKLLFFPINFILAKSAFNPDQKQTISDNPEFLVFIIIIIVCNIFLVIIFCIGSSTLIDLQDISCTKGITIFIMDIIYKIIIIGLTIWYQFVPEKNIQWMILLINLLFVTLVYYITYKKSMFNNSGLQSASLMIRIICCICSLMMITSGILEGTIGKMNLETFWISWIIFSILVCTITINMVKKQREVYAIIFDDEIKDEKDFIDKIIYMHNVCATTHKIFYRFQTIDHSIYDIETILAGYKLSFQRNYGKHLHLSLENSLKRINNDHYSDNFMIIFELIKNLGQIIMRKYPNYYIAKLFITNIFIDHCIFLKYTATFLYETKIRGNHNFIMKAYIKYLTKKLEVQMRNKYKKINKLNIEKYMKEIKLSQKIEMMMHTILQDQLTFWNEINAEIISTENLLKYAITCYDKTQKLHKVWEYYNSYRKFTISRPYLQYYLFHLMTNAPSSKAEIYLKQYEVIAKKIKESAKYDKFDENSLRSPNNVIIIMSGNLSSLGKIIYCSQSVSSELNHDHEKIIGSHVGILMPKFYQDNHDIFIKRYYDTGKSFVLNKSLLKPIKDGNGYLKPMLANITIYSYLNEGLVFLAVMKPSTMYQNVILLAPDGEIHGLSKDIDEVLELNDTNAKNYAYDLCKEFEKIQLVFNFFTSLELIKCNVDNQDKKMRIFSNYEELIIKSNETMPEKHQIDSIEIIRQVALQPKQNQNKMILADEIYKWEEYDKWHQLYEEFRTIGKIKFIPKHDKTKIVMMTCKIQDEIYQNASFLRLILIDNIDIDYVRSIPKLDKSDDLDEGLKHLPTSRPFMLKKNTRPLLDSITLHKEVLESPHHIGARRDSFEPNTIEYQINNFMIKAKNDYKVSDRQQIQRFEITNTISSKKIQYIESKIELAFEHNYIDFPTKFLLIAVACYFLGFLGLNFYLFVYKQQFDQDIVSNSEIMFTSSLALRNLYDVINICTEIYGLQMGYIRNDLWVSADIDDLSYYDILDVKSRSKNYQDYVSAFSKYIYRLDKSLQDKIFQSQIRFYQVDLDKRQKITNDYQIYNILSAASLVTETFIQIGSIPYEERFNLSYPLYFLISNAFDDLYSANQLMNTIVQETIQKQFEDAYKIIFTSFTTAIILSGMLFIYFISQIARFNGILRDFLVQIIKIHQSKSMAIIRKLRNFNYIFEKNYEDQHIERFLEKSTKKYEQIKTGSIKKIELKSFDQIRFSNVWQIKYVFFFGIMVSFVISYYTFLYFEWSKQTKAQHLAINQLIFLSGRFTNLSIGIAACYIYAIGNSSFTFRNREMGPEIEIIYESIGDIQGYYDLFLQEDKKHFEYEYILKGNYCAIANGIDLNYCVIAGHQVAENGLISMDKFLSINLEYVKDMFDQSNRSNEIISELMNSPTFTSITGLNYFITTYAYIDLINAIKYNLDKLLLEQTYALIQTLLLMALFYGPSLIIFYGAILKMLVRFYPKLKKVMRMLPIKLIISNSYLKIFLIKISNPILGSIQNKLNDD